MRFPVISRLILLCLAELVCVAGQALALPSLHEVAQAVDQHYDRLRTLQADFTEIYQGAANAQSVSGTPWLQTPGTRCWQYRPPKEKLMTADANNALMDTPAE